MTDHTIPDPTEPDHGCDPYEMEPHTLHEEEPGSPHRGRRHAPSVFEVLWDLVHAERNAIDSGKWYGTWDYTWAQEALMQETLSELRDLSGPSLLDAFMQFKLEVEQHLYACPLMDAPPPAPPAPPTLGPLGYKEVEQLRARAQELRSPEGRLERLPRAANEALALLWEAHADLGELLWDEFGGVLLDATGLPGCTGA